MSDRKHALLSPSGAHRWMVCTPSAVLESKLPDNETDYAREGTLAHELAEGYLRLLLGGISQNEFDILLEGVKTHRLYKAEMLTYCHDYALYVHSIFVNLKKQYGDAVSIFIEIKINLRKYARGSYGHLDAAIAAPGMLFIFDFKYGQGVPVDAEENEQMMCYAIGCLEYLKYVDDYNVVSMCIFQPRINNISTWTIFKERLLKWVREELTPSALLAFNGQGKYVAGEHCKFCRAKATCRTLAAHVKELTDGMNYELPGLLLTKEISKILNSTDFIIDYLRSVKSHALSEALKGKKFPGFKIVEGTSRRVLIEQKKIIKRLSLLYEECDYLNSDLKGIGDLENLIGKKDFDKVLGPYVIKPKGAPALVPDTDKRIAYGSAADVFKDIIVD